jgi:hypothetical protein
MISAGPIIILLGLSAILSVAAIGVSLFAVWRAQILVVLSDERARAGLKQCQETGVALQKVLDGQAERLELVEQQPPEAASPAVPRAGLNLCKRSQALRMHRQGDPPDRIAATLEVPLQEVDLLLKVHRIVIGKL